MKRPIFNWIGFKAFIVAFVLLFSIQSGANAAYCTPTQGYFSSGLYMYINMVMFNKVCISKWDGSRDGNGNLILPCYAQPAYNGYPNYSGVIAGNPVVKVKVNTKYDVTCYGGIYYLYYDGSSSLPENVSYYTYSYPQDFAIYIDLDQNGKFEETERVGSSISAFSYNPTFSVAIPKTAKGGNTTMRIVCDYAYNYGNQITACGTYYGETRDFAVSISGGVDIGISQITAPAPPLTIGVHTVKAMLKNYSEDAVTSCIIKWSVDGVDQTPINWTGNLAGLSQQEVTLGDYDFESKGVKSMFTIMASTSKPNGDDDATPLNDGSPAYSLSLPIAPGTLYIGGTNYDFATLKEAVDLISTAGIKGDGAFIFEIRPGTQTGPFVLNNLPHGNNPFVFENDPANTGVVNLTAVTTSFDYVFYVNNMPNVTFRNLTFSAKDPDYNGSRLVQIQGNADNFVFENNILNGATTLKMTDYADALLDMRASSMNNAKITRNTFNDGYQSLLLINSAGTSSGIIIDKNKINTFTNRAIDVEGIANAVISNNVIKGSTKASVFGINVLNGSTITNNAISGIIGTTSPIGSGINVVHTTNVPATISSNSVTGSTGINGISATGIKGGEINNNNINLGNLNYTTATNGILLTSTTPVSNKVIISQNTVNIENGYGLNVLNYNTDVLKNVLTSSNSGSKVALRGVSATNSNGMILLNACISGGEAMQINKSNFTIAYNSTLSIGSANALTMDAGNNKIFRNQFVNNGTGNAFAITSLSTNVFGQNNYYSTTGTIGTVGGTPYTSVSQLNPIDKGAISTDPNYLDNFTLKITSLKEELVFNSPIANLTWPAGYQSAYEETTLDGRYRNGVYYVGSYTIVPVVDIYKFTKELIDCSGAKDMAIVCSGKANLGSQPKYQWYKDGVELPGETNHKLSFPNFDYLTSGIYKCRVSAPGVAQPLWTDDIPVYAMTVPEITDQPKEVINAQIGGTYTFEVKAHYRGMVPPEYKDFFQWYKYTAATDQLTALPTNTKFGGSTSSQLVITGLEDTDICGKGDYYYVEIISQCGTVRSNPFIISQKPEVVFRDNPTDINVCPNTNVVFSAFAVAPEGYKVTYRWQKDGADLTDNAMYNGVNTTKLQILGAGITEAGSYICIAEIASESILVKSSPANLTFKALPDAMAIGGTDYSIKRGEDVTFAVKLLAGVEPLTVKWTFNGEVIKHGTWDIYNGTDLMMLTLEAINENQAGQYVCTLENECSTKVVTFNLTVKKWDETGSSVDVVTENGYSLYTAVPNPANDLTTVNYVMPKAGQVKFTLSDMTGRVLRNLYEGYAVEGMNTLQLNVKTLGLPSGVYFYTMTSDNFSGVRSFVISQ